jgi:hypothetical protein
MCLRDFKRDLVAERKRRGPEVVKELTGPRLARLVLDALPMELLSKPTPSPFDGMTADGIGKLLADVRAYRAARFARSNDPLLIIQVIEGVQLLFAVAALGAR